MSVRIRTWDTEVHPGPGGVMFEHRRMGELEVGLRSDFFGIEMATDFVRGQS